MPISGTSPIESLNSRFSHAKPQSISKTNWNTIHTIIGSIILNHNNTILNKLNHLQSLETKLFEYEDTAYLRFGCEYVCPYQSLEDYQKAGFRTKSGHYDWTNEELNQLKNVITEIHLNPGIVEVKDIYYWISHYRFDSKLTSKQIKSKCLSMFNDLNISEILNSDTSSDNSDNDSDNNM